MRRRSSGRRYWASARSAAGADGETLDVEAQQYVLPLQTYSFGYAPRVVQRLLSRLAASPRAFNLVVSNIPGPREPLYMLGCELAEVYPVVPLADGHAVSIGMTTIKDEAFFGIYADRESLPDADLLAECLDESLDELLALDRGGSDA